jgi:hypothetical protein
MLTNWRIPLTWTLAILYGFVSAMGEGLHLLPGQAHDACCQHGDACPDEACLADDGPCDDGCDAATEPQGDFSSGDFSSSRPVIGSVPLAHDPDHCAICEFLGQGTWFLRPVAIPNWRFFRAFHPPGRAIFVACRPERLPFLSRAPPAAVDC